jgi:peptidoglycan/xylan/chitin deacetylase (PgdA/CDA1 family)
MRTTIRLLALSTVLLGALPLRALLMPPRARRAELALTPREPAAQRPAASTRRFTVPVLMYHRVCDLSEREARNALLRDLTVAPAAFDRQMRYLAENGFSVLLAREVEKAVRGGTPLPRRAVAVTMDDGYRDNFEHAFPILCRYRLPATLFLVTGSIGRTDHLAWDEIGIMHRKQVGYGSHTVHHADLTLLPLAQLDFELRESKRVIEDRLIERITAVAYPAGKYNHMVAARAEAAGYLAGWKKGGGPVRPGADPYLLPRVRVRGGTTLDEFRRKVWSGVNARTGTGAQRLPPSAHDGARM